MRDFNIFSPRKIEDWLEGQNPGKNPLPEEPVLRDFIKKRRIVQLELLLYFLPEDEENWWRKKVLDILQSVKSQGEKNDD